MLSLFCSFQVFKPYPANIFCHENGAGLLLLSHIFNSLQNTFTIKANNMNPDLKLNSHRSSLIWVHLTARIALEQDTCIRSLVLVRLRNTCPNISEKSVAQWLSGRVFDPRPTGRGLEPHRRHRVVVLEQDTFILA